MNPEEYVNLLSSKDIFKIGDWFYLDRRAVPRNIKKQDIINIKLGAKTNLNMKGMVNEEQNIYIRQIIAIKNLKLFFDENQTLIIRMRK